MWQTNFNLMKKYLCNKLVLVSQKGWNKGLTNIVVEFYYSLGKMSSILRRYSPQFNWTKYYRDTESMKQMSNLEKEKTFIHQFFSPIFENSLLRGNEM